MSPGVSKALKVVALPPTVKRMAIISDVHANATAFKVCLREINNRGIKQIINLGDLVGYGAEPNECVALAQSHDMISLAGNHDLAALNDKYAFNFNSSALKSVRWTARELNQSAIKYLENLPLTLLLQLPSTELIQIAHGNLRDYCSEYIIGPSDAEANFAEITTSLVFLGHTHRPVIWQQAGPHAFSYLTPVAGVCEYFNPAEKRLINPGSVGQPRDGDFRASFMIFDISARSVELCRIDYDIAETARKIAAANLPLYNAERLISGK
jgi:predicted phosphodiesterase